MTAYLWLNLLSSVILGAVLVVPLAADRDKSPFPILVPPRSVGRFEVAFKLAIYIAYGTWTAYLMMP